MLGATYIKIDFLGELVEAIIFNHLGDEVEFMLIDPLTPKSPLVEDGIGVYRGIYLVDGEPRAAAIIGEWKSNFELAGMITDPKDLMLIQGFAELLGV